MNRPYARITKSKPMLARQKYAFPIKDFDGNRSWERIIEILCEDVEFHELLAKHNIKVMIESDWHIRFQNTGGAVDGPRYSRVMKALWDRFKPLFSDYGLVLRNNYTQEFLA